MIMHVIECIADSYDSTDGTYYEPPGLLEEFNNGLPLELTPDQIGCVMRMGSLSLCH